MTYVPDTPPVPAGAPPRAQLEALTEEVTAAYENGQLHRIYHAVYNFCVKEMSSFYLDVLKDRLYTDARESVSGRSSRT